MKNITVPVAVFFAILGLVLAVSANVTTSEITKDLDKERYSRMVLEEQLQQANQTIERLNDEIVESRNKMDGIQKILNDGKTTNTTLKSQLDTIAKERDSLKEKLEQVDDPRQTLPIVPTEPGSKL